MNKYEQEILNRFGKRLLSNIRSDFTDGFQIVAIDDLVIVVGNKIKNVAYSRKTFTTKETFTFPSGVKLNRKIT